MPSSEPGGSSSASGRSHSEEESSLHKEESREAEERSAPGGHIVYGAIESEGEEELSRSNSALAWSGLAAGLSMGFSMMTQALLTQALPHTHWADLVSKLGYGVGYLVVILGRQQLFTENTLTVILPLLKRREAGVLFNVLRLWLVVLSANLLGTLIFAWVAGHTEVFTPEARSAFVELGRDVMAPSASAIFLRAIFCGWLIALMVWLLPFAETARIWVIWVITYVVALGDFSHVVAGSVDSLYLVVTGEKSLGEYLVHFLVPTFFGNVLGGVSLVAALAHAQFVGSEQEKEEAPQEK